MLKVLAIGVGGFGGAVLRYGAGLLAHRLLGVTFPWGTLFVNVTGCLVMGAVAAVIERGGLASDPWRALVVLGLLGSFTTFSTFGVEVVSLAESAHWRPLFLYLAGSLSLGVGALLVGRSLVRAFAS